MNSNTTIFKYNINTNGEPISVRIDNENKMVSPLYYTIQLEQIPDEFHRIVVLNENKTPMTEVFNLEDVSSENEFYVDYNVGKIYLHSSQAGKTKGLSYYGQGIELFSCERIYDSTTYKETNIIKTIQEIIDAGRECLEAMEVYGDIIDVFNLLKDTITEGYNVDEQLHDTIDEARDVDRQINNLTKVVQVTDWTVIESGDYIGFYEVTIPHTMNSMNLIVQFWSDSINQSLSGIKMIDNNNIQLINDVAIGGKLVCNKSYYAQSGVVDMATYNTSQLPQTVDYRFVNDKELTDVRNIPNLDSKIGNIMNTSIPEIYNNIGYLNSTKMRISIKDFTCDDGVKVKGDGIHDDSTGIQKALDYCKNNNIPELLIPLGIYYVTKPLKTYRIRLIGMGWNVPLLGWDYTRPNGTDDYAKYKVKCGGSIITTDRDISIIDGSLIADDLGFFGNRRALNQCCVKGNNISGYDSHCHINNVAMVGFGLHAIHLPYGTINPYITRCHLEQNGSHGLYLGKTVEGYTGESNRITIRDTSFNRNEMGGIGGEAQGRHIVIENNTFEAIGEVSDAQRVKPTGLNDIKWGINLKLYNSGAWGNGSIDLENNYLEETYGFAKIVTENPANTVKVTGTLWRPHTQQYYSCFVCFGGYMNNINVTNNNAYTQYDYIKFTDFNSRNFVTDLPCDYDAAMNMVGDPTGVTKDTFINIRGYGTKTYKSFPSGFIKNITFDSSFVSGEYFPAGCSYVYIDESKAGGFNFGGTATLGNHFLSGYGLKINGKLVGVISGYNATLKLFNIRGNISSAFVGTGTAELVQLSGMYVLNGKGDKIKIVYDWDNKPLPYGN